ncbi:uncharacterized protein LOC110045313 [Orbicella faveolata]|uniref:uncharacterized protein LOC110045313 n=1 Tax=Orbicella faveolata TaxID=48498 RepID=UPI0009E57C1C|nr:uncharacterized protein LOC110045313 [Orbicella faveolata]
MEVAKRSGGGYPPKTVYGINCALKHYLEEKKGSEALNPLDTSDKRFVLFRRCLDAEMKDGVREGLHIKCKKEVKESVSEQEEATFWEKELLGTRSISTTNLLLLRMLFSRKEIKKLYN